MLPNGLAGDDVDEAALTAFYAEVGRRIREARSARQLTQEALARQVQLQRASVANIERGKQKLLLHTFQELCDALRVTPLELLPTLPTSRASEEAEELPSDLSDREKAWVRSLVADA